MNGIFGAYTSIPIIVVPDNKKQNRTHKKRELIRNGLKNMDIQYITLLKMKRLLWWMEICMWIRERIIIWDLLNYRLRNIFCVEVNKVTRKEELEAEEAELYERINELCQKNGITG